MAAGTVTSTTSNGVTSYYYSMGDGETPAQAVTGQQNYLISQGVSSAQARTIANPDAIQQEANTPPPPPPRQTANQRWDSRSQGGAPSPTESARNSGSKIFGNVAYQILRNQSPTPSVLSSDLQVGEKVLLDVGIFGFTRPRGALESPITDRRLTTHETGEVIGKETVGGSTSISVKGGQKFYEFFPAKTETVDGVSVDYLPQIASTDEASYTVNNREFLPRSTGKLSKEGAVDLSMAQQERANATYDFPALKTPAGMSYVKGTTELYRDYNKAPQTKYEMLDIQVAGALDVLAPRAASGAGLFLGTARMNLDASDVHGVITGSNLGRQFDYDVKGFRVSQSKSSGKAFVSDTLITQPATMLAREFGKGVVIKYDRRREKITAEQLPEFNALVKKQSEAGTFETAVNIGVVGAFELGGAYFAKAPKVRYEHRSGEFKSEKPSGIFASMETPKVTTTYGDAFTTGRLPNMQASRDVTKQMSLYGWTLPEQVGKDVTAQALKPEVGGLSGQYLRTDEAGRLYAGKTFFKEKDLITIEGGERNLVATNIPFPSKMGTSRLSGVELKVEMGTPSQSVKFSIPSQPMLVRGRTQGFQYDIPINPSISQKGGLYRQKGYSITSDIETARWLQPIKKGEGSATSGFSFAKMERGSPKTPFKHGTPKPLQLEGVKKLDSGFKELPSSGGNQPQALIERTKTETVQKEIQVPKLEALRKMDYAKPEALNTYRHMPLQAVTVPMMKMAQAQKSDRLMAYAPPVGKLAYRMPTLSMAANAKMAPIGMHKYAQKSMQIGKVKPLQYEYPRAKVPDIPEPQPKPGFGGNDFGMPPVIPPFAFGGSGGAGGAQPGGKSPTKRMKTVSIGTLMLRNLKRRFK